MVDIVANLNPSVPAPVEGVQIPVIDRMKAELLADEAEESSEGGREEQESVVPSEASSEEGSESEDASEESEEASPESPTGDKKPNRYQRIKAKAEAEVAAVRAQVLSVKKEAVDALGIANQWRAEALAQKARFEALVRDHQIELDPREQELYTARRQLAQRDLAEQVGQMTIAEQQKLAQEQAKQAGTAQLRSAYIEQANTLLKQYPGLNGKDLLLGYAGLVEAGEKSITLAQVAKNMAAARGLPARAQAEREQLRVNSGAPQTIKATRNVPLKTDHSIAGMKALLVAQGLG